MGEIVPTRVTQGKTYKDNEERYASAHALDKDLSTAAATNTDDGTGWMKIEFDKTYFIHKVVIHYMFYTNWYNFGDYCAHSEANFRYCINNDNNVDVSVYQGEVQQKSCGTLQLTDGLEQSDQIYTLFCNTEGDTVKLSKDKGLVVVYEIGVLKVDEGK